MAMPIDLVFVRHGQAEHNLASKYSKLGDHSLYTEEFRARPPSQHRLTDLGRRQARAAGKWLKQNGFQQFDRRYVSDYIRAKETAAYLKVKGPDWLIDYLLREREWGDWDNLNWEQRSQKTAQSLDLRETDPFYWIPPNGESMAQMTVRLRNLFNTLHRECAEMKVLVVCHGEVMWAFRQMVERLPLGKWAKLEQSKSPQDKIHNCQIIHYTRRNPKTGKLSQRLDWMRSVCPWDEALSSNNWQTINRRRFSDVELKAFVERTKPLFKGIKQPKDW
ncbi:histidine phosphatase family protein [Candidatus Microgenomates bacterium]|nr:histidine phosphatase family protein [Candidatus Microgenomates bacterium]